LGINTPLPAFFPLFIGSLEVFARKAVKGPRRSYLDRWNRVKSLPFQVFFNMGEQTTVAGIKVGAAGGLRQCCHVKLSQNFSGSERRVRGCIVVVNNPIVFYLWADAVDSILQMELYRQLI
jgi:hypothetical protein